MEDNLMPRKRDMKDTITVLGGLALMFAGIWFAAWTLDRFNTEHPPYAAAGIFSGIILIVGSGLMIYGVAVKRKWMD
jgi:hypothetical protein